MTTRQTVACCVDLGNRAMFEDKQTLIILAFNSSMYSMPLKFISRGNYKFFLNHIGDYVK